MKVGIISDTHDDIQLTKEAVEIFHTRNVDIIIHAGDFTSPEMLRLFKDNNCKFVLGNGDIDVERINMESQECGFECITDVCDFNIDDKRILVIHGDKVPVFREAVSSGKYNYIIKGHTHLFEDYISKNSRILNPGSFAIGRGGFILILDTITDSLEKIRIGIDL